MAGTAAQWARRRVRHLAAPGALEPCAAGEGGGLHAPGGLNLAMTAARRLGCGPTGAADCSTRSGLVFWLPRPACH